MYSNIHKGEEAVWEDNTSKRQFKTKIKSLKPLKQLWEAFSLTKTSKSAGYSLGSEMSSVLCSSLQINPTSKIYSTIYPAHILTCL